MASYYVTDTGSNSNDGLSPATAWLTISYAISQVTSGSIINISGSFTINSTIIIDKELTLTTTDYATIIKTTVGDLFLVQSSNVTISLLNLSQTTSNLADFLINVDRGSTGTTPPANYSNVVISGCTLRMWKYGICLNGLNNTINGCDFLRQGGTERLSCIIIYYINVATITACTVTDSLRMQRFIYLTSAGTVGSPYYNEVNTKTGLITVTNNSTSCSSTVQGLQFIIQDSFIGTALDYSVALNQLNDSVVPTKLFIAYITNGTDLDTLGNVSVFNNYSSLTQTGAVLIDSAAPVTVPVVQLFNVYDNTGNFTLRPDYTGNINFTQQTTNVSPANLANNPAVVVYSAVGGGDPHIMDIHGIKTTLPNDWYRFVMYKSDTFTVIAKAEFIGNYLLSHQLHYLLDGLVTDIDIYKNFWVTNFTYITEITVTKNNRPAADSLQPLDIKHPRQLVFDTINGFVKYDNSSIMYRKSDVPLFSLTHNCKYPAKRLTAFEIDLEPDKLILSVDNYWDDINSILLFPRSNMTNKTGELIKHSENNKLE